ncbi:hypothetical protein [Psychrobacillus sp. FSL H8-0510]
MRKATDKKKVTPLKVTQFKGETKMEKENNKLLKMLKERRG